jgi:hypothetical protein
MNIAIASLPARTSYHAVFHFVSSRPGVWYVKAAIYHKSELIKATTRTLYIREANMTKHRSVRLWWTTLIGCNDFIRSFPSGLISKADLSS